MILPGNVDPRTAVPSNREREMAVYDALPESLRRLFREASQNYTVVDYARALVQGAPVSAITSAVQAEERYVRRQHERRIALGAPPPS